MSAIKSRWAMQQINITRISVGRNHGLDGELGNVVECANPTDVADILVRKIVSVGPIDSQVSHKNNAFCGQIGHSIASGVGLSVLDELDPILAFVKYEAILKSNRWQFQMFQIDLGLIPDIFHSLGAQL